MKNILVITSSHRKNSNSNMLAEQFIKGAVEANNVERVDLSEKQINFCRGCLACQTLKKCVIKDDAALIAEKMGRADVLVFVTPIYYYSVSGQLKTMLDRANPLYGSDYSFRSVYLIATAADEDSRAVDGAVKAVQGWVDCFENAKLECVLFAGGVEAQGDVKDNIAMCKAYELGKQII